MQHFCRDDIFIIAAVKNSDLPARRQRFVYAPEVVMRQLLLRRALEAGDPHSLRIHAAYGMADQRVLARRVQSLQHENDAFLFAGIEPVLQLAHFRKILLKLLQNLRFGYAIPAAVCREFFQMAFLCSIDPVFIRFHFLLRCCTVFHAQADRRLLPRRHYNQYNIIRAM